MPDSFKLDQRLNNDCLHLGKFNDSVLLLMDNSLVPWLILVPVTKVIEFDLLEEQQQFSLMRQVNQLAAFLRQQFQFDKLNIATIGNIVRQMHIHIVARSENDYCWPGVVWGADGKKTWAEEDLEKFIEQLEIAFPDNFIRSRVSFSSE